ncbi:MAG: 23S rRNA (adenine(2503)-C(2))-methyltransferase RlmN [Candidatus Peregrinibacteria bacterium]
MTRQEQFQALFPGEKPFRWKQMEQALFQPNLQTWSDITSLGKAMRETLEQEVPWVSWSESQVFTSSKRDTYKALLTLEDGLQIETVLMENSRGDWTMCVSSQVGCAMKCGFCATGKMGLKRSLTSDEITDQYRFWTQYLKKNSPSPQRISNAVFMGMGEPLANYDNVKKTIQTWLAYTDLGPTHITVSTVGLIPLLQKILTDPDWPHVRLAVSLHSADPKTRKEIVPTSHPKFIPLFKAWAHEYLERFGNRRHHLTFEYVMLKDVNDTPHHAQALAELVNDLGQIKVNLIPYNFTHLGFKRSLDSQIYQFKDFLTRNGVDVTVRKTMGDDIAAACGQLITETNS